MATKESTGGLFGRIALKKGLVADGVTFTSETDTEVAAHLVARAYAASGDLTQAMQEVVNRLEGGEIYSKA